MLQTVILKNMPPIIFEALAKKEKNPKLPNSYRPTYILSVLDKLFEMVILHRLLSHSVINNIINKEQFGFRKEHTTVHQIKRVTNFIENNKSIRKGY